MADEGFPLPISSYEELTKIVKAYGQAREACELAAISQLTAMNTTMISANNGFLLATGIIAGGKKKSITAAGLALAHALEHEMPDEITRTWRELVQGNEFFQKLYSAVRIRNGMEVSTFHAHVAYTAGQPKRPQVMTGARTVTEILRAAGLLKEEDGRLVALTGTEGTTKADVPAASLDSATVDTPALHPALIQRSLLVGASGRVNINIEISVQCTAAELLEVGKNLRKVISDLEHKDEAQPEK